MPGLSNVVAIATGDNFHLALVANELPLAAIVPQSLGFDRVQQTFSFSLPTLTGRIFFLEYKNSLSDATWTTLPPIAGDGTIRTFTDSATTSQRFYRVRYY